MACAKDMIIPAVVGGMVGAAVYMMMPHKTHHEIEHGMRMAADELSGVSKELGKAIKSIGETMV